MLFSLLVGHDAVFAVQFGLGDGIREAMTASGHDGYWMAFSLIVVVLTAGVLGRESVRAIRIARRLRAPSSTAAQARERPVGDRGFRREFRSIWPILFVSTCLAFTVQENLEHIAAGLAPHGAGSLIGTEHPFAVPVLAAVSALLAAVGALIRWRLRVARRVAGSRSGDRPARLPSFTLVPRLTPAPPRACPGQRRGIDNGRLIDGPRAGSMGPAGPGARPDRAGPGGQFGAAARPGP